MRPLRRAARWLVLSGGVVDPTTVSNGGVMTVSSGGTAEDTIVLSGGQLVVDSGGTDLDATINSGGTATVFGTDISATITGTSAVSGLMLVSSGGVVSAATVSGGGKIQASPAVRQSRIRWPATASTALSRVLSGGTALDTTVSNTGKLNVRAGGYASGTIVEANNFGSGSNGGLETSPQAAPRAAPRSSAVALDSYPAAASTAAAPWCRGVVSLLRLYSSGLVISATADSSGRHQRLRRRHAL